MARLTNSTTNSTQRTEVPSTTQSSELSDLNLPISVLNKFDERFNHQLDSSIFDTPTAKDLFDNPALIVAGQEYLVLLGSGWEKRELVGDGKGNLNTEVSRYYLGKAAGIPDSQNPLPDSMKPKKSEQAFRPESVQGHDYEILKSKVTIASHYGIGDGFHGRKTANGETFNAYAMTAAHPDLPFGTKIKVTNLDNGASVVVRVNDRGPYVHGRGIDLSSGAARKIGLKGVGSVKLDILKG